MDLGLTGKRALVTGASKGIGLAITAPWSPRVRRVIAGSRSASDELRHAGRRRPGPIGEASIYRPPTVRPNLLRPRSRTVRSTCSSTMSVP